MTQTLLPNHYSLFRKVNSLSEEMAYWLDWAIQSGVLEKNYTQIDKVKKFVRIFDDQVKSRFKEANPRGDIDKYLSISKDTSANVTKLQLIWDFYRSRLELRFVPLFKNPLLAADLVAHDCYYAVIQQAKRLKIQVPPTLVDYPITGLASTWSPYTYPRGRRPVGFENKGLPVPVIDLPYELLSNPWDWLVIAHETGHDLDQDLGNITQELQGILEIKLPETGISQMRIEIWKNWIAEILADGIGVLLTGPAFVLTLKDFLTLPKQNVCTSFEKYPPHYVRIFILIELLRQIGFGPDADRIATEWKSLYEQNGPLQIELPDDEIASVISVMFNSPLNLLSNPEGNCFTLRQLIPFSQENHSQIDEACAMLLEYHEPWRLPIRYLISASRLAFQKMANANKEDMKKQDQFSQLAKGTIDSAIAFAPLGKLTTTPPIDQHFKNLVQKSLDRPLEDFFSIYLP